MAVVVVVAAIVYRSSIEHNGVENSSDEDVVSFLYCVVQHSGAILVLTEDLRFGV